MIQMIRVDDRLLHGQVAMSWRAELGYQALVIANDRVSNSSIEKQAMSLAAPSGVKLAIRGVEDAITLLKNPLLKDLKVMVLCYSPEDAYKILSSIDEKPKINIGGMRSNPGKKEIAKAVFVDEEDISYLDKLKEKSEEVFFQQTPSSRKRVY